MDALAVCVEDLCDLFREVSDGTVDLTPAAAGAPLAELGIESMTFIAFLAATEERYGTVWGEDTPDGTFESLATIAEHLCRA